MRCAGDTRVASAALCLLAMAACRDAPESLSRILASPTAVAREARLERELTQPDTTVERAEPLARWVLPRELREISGLATTPDGRLLAESDEFGTVWQVDYRRGILVKRFQLGDGVKGDFEGITTAGGHDYLLTSKGKLYEFPDGANGAHVPYREYDSRLKAACEFEGVAYDASINSMLLACKHVRDSSAHHAVVIYRWRLTGDTAGALTRLVVPDDSIIGTNGWHSIHPSDITVDPFSGNYVLVASQERALFSITPQGHVVFARTLPPEHKQAEGVAITRDSLLVVSDEGGDGLGTITVYKWP